MKHILMICISYVGPGAQPLLKSWGGWVPTSGRARAPRPAKGWVLGAVYRGSPPPAVRVRGYHSRKIFENSDAKSCILVTTCCEIFCLLKTTAKKFGDQYEQKQSPPDPSQYVDIKVKCTQCIKVETIHLMQYILFTCIHIGSDIILTLLSKVLASRRLRLQSTGPRKENKRIIPIIRVFYFFEQFVRMTTYSILAYTYARTFQTIDSFVLDSCYLYMHIAMQQATYWTEKMCAWL